MKIGTKLLSLVLLTVSICQVSREEEADKKCEWSEYKCGNVCVGNTQHCYCGNVTLSRHSSYYCCLASEESCTYKYTWGGAATCRKGTPVPRIKTCNGKCPVDSPPNTTNVEGKIICNACGIIE